MAFPIVQAIQQDPTINPSGFRADLNPAKGFIKQLGTGAGQHLDFGAMNIVPTGNISATKLIYYRVSSFGVGSGIFNMRYYLKNTSAFTAGTYRFLEKKTLDFIPSFSISEADNDTPIIVPAQGNYISTRRITAGRGDNAISGIFDQDTGEYIYLGVLAKVDVPVGQKGGAGAGSFRFRLIYDFS